MIVVVGGHSRNIGKTSVMCGIISGLPERAWTAVKITQYGHGVCSKRGEPCECFDPRQPIALSEEASPDPNTDSGRYVVAGARRSFWLRSPVGRLAEAMPYFRELEASSADLIVESNSLLGFLRPDLFVMVVDGAVADFKPSSRKFFDRADLVVPTSPALLTWPEFPPSLLASKRIIAALAPSYRSPALNDEIRARILKVPPSSADQSNG